MGGVGITFLAGLGFRCTELRLSWGLFLGRGGKFTVDF